MKAAKLVPIDLGYGWVKAAAWGTPSTFTQPSIVGNTKKLLETNIQADDVRYYTRHSEGGEAVYRAAHFAGNLAVRHSDVRYFSTKSEKAETWTSEVLMQTALGVLAPQGSVNIVTGLPYDFYFDQKDGITQMLEGLSQKPFGVRIGNGRLVEACPVIERVKVIPQAFAAGMDYLLGDDGQLARRDEARQRLLVSDWGRYTWDVLILEGMEIRPESFSRDDLGIEAAYKLLRRYLREAIGNAPSNWSMDQYVITGKYEGYDIRPLVEKAFRAVITQMQLEIEGLNMHFHKALLVGGQSEAQHRYLELPPEIKEKGNQLSNMNGYGKVGVRSWGVE